MFDIVLLYGEKIPMHFWRIPIVAGVLPSRDSEIRGAVKISENSENCKDQYSLQTSHK